MTINFWYNKQALGSSSQTCVNGCCSQIREQMSDPDLHVFTLKLLAKLAFLP